mmetsp:Transcript_27981/g.33129  ORF Transcript_27981/g.33129 Transcript_27981/m.33129 type:complete len:220 (+) Transcript_27981:94-753(+)|eukprot:CAMPEP_0198254396 /NCGR_PEP_ID=MMETSP1447-20131203/4702_1 /TAXON_ID=420782 /ORGANISM="Chaetoceros dichaeta, Strain CCMP1751" /LENGTH=219 /DNA_ID=CAMNT_0043940427 /DNA_START=48 /DNA_END=707 /DNA_ORIENTATION=-
MSSTTAADLNENALRDSIDKKGKNSYYFAHAHRANGPKWDGKPQPRLLSKQAIPSNDHNSTTGEGVDLETPINTDSILSLNKLQLSTSSFAYSQSNITKYAFLDDGEKVKLYVEMNGVGDACTKEDVSLQWDENSFTLVIKNYPGPLTSGEGDEGIRTPADCPVRCLNLGKLYGDISDASFRKKKDRVIVTLVKRVEGDDEPMDWPSIRANSGGENDVD